MRKREKGQELAEFGIVVVLFMAIAVGTLTFAHAFLVANMITHAIRDGARISATWPGRTSTCGLIDQATVQPIKDNVIGAISTVVGASKARTFQVSVSQTPQPVSAPPCTTPPPQTPTVDVNVQGCVPFIFPIIPHALGTNCGQGLGFQVNRTVSFHDEKIPKAS